MKSPQVTSGRISKISSGWFSGVNSVRNPWALAENQFAWGENVQVRGGLVQTRPGQKMRLSLPPGNFQGGIFFSANKQKEAAITNEFENRVTITPPKIFNTDGDGVVAQEIPYLVFAVNGSVYYAPFPLEQPKDWSQFKLQNVFLDPNVNQFSFCVATKSANISGSKDELITPSYRVVFIQDGVSSPAYWDGSNKLGNQDKTVPTGFWMAFSGDRLWVANNNIVIASDYADPTSWNERTTGVARGDFSFNRPITGLVSFVGQDTSTRLVVFTDRSTFSLASGIIDRSLWTKTQNFQNTLYPTVGCVAGKSICFQAGQMWWYSQGGLVAADVAAASYLSSQVLYKDIEMARTKKYLAPDTSGICSAAFENYLMISVPYLENLNSHTMVMDYAAASEWTQQRTPAWCGVWTGTRPVEWTTGTIDGQQRCFHFSVDYVATNDGSYNHLWESFMPEKYDTFLSIQSDGSAKEEINRIYCSMETALLGDGMDLKQFIYSEIECKEIGGVVDVQVSFRGSKGQYKEILKKRILAVTDDFQWENSSYEKDIEKLGFLNTQYRRLITESSQRTVDYESCESEYTVDIDKAFSILVEWCGQLGVEIIRFYLDPYATKALGVPQSDETKYCVVGQEGRNLTIEDLPDAYIPVEGQQTSFFARTSKTITLGCPNNSPAISATAQASFLSYVSYDHALEEAGRLALQQATAAAQKYRAENPC